MLSQKARGAGGIGGGSAIEFVGAVSASGDNQLDLTGITGLSEGDAVFIFAMDDALNFTFDESRASGRADATDSDWTGYNAPFLGQGGYPENTGTSSIEHLQAARIQPAIVDESIHFSATLDVIAAIAFRNVGSLDSPISEEDIDTNSSSINIGPVSGIVAGSVSIIGTMLDDDNSTINTTPSGYTLATQAARFGGSMALMYQLDLPAGSHNPGSISWNASDSQYAVMRIFPQA
jgi:hypothetical protein